jgi:nicotinamidase-related amidase
MTVEPSRTALLLMDFQNAIVERFTAGDGGALLRTTAAAVAAARSAGVTVGHVGVAFTDEDRAAIPDRNKSFAPMAANGYLAVGSGPAAFHDDLAPVDGDVVVRKRRVGAFSTTDLAARLAERGVDTLVLAGIATSGVVLSTVRDAADRDYRLFVLADACADLDPEVHRVLTEQVFPRQAEVIDVAAFTAALPG